MDGALLLETRIMERMMNSFGDIVFLVGADVTQPNEEKPCEYIVVMNFEFPYTAWKKRTMSSLFFYTNFIPRFQNAFNEVYISDVNLTEDRPNCVTRAMIMFRARIKETPKYGDE